MSQPLSVLIVDDEWDIAHLFSLHLVGSGFDAISFTEPLLALNHFKQDPTQVLFGSCRFVYGRSKWSGISQRDKKV